MRFHTQIWIHMYVVWNDLLELKLCLMNLSAFKVSVADF